MSDESNTSCLSTHHSLLITSLTELSMAERIVSKRELLLVEVERWCGDPACGARTRLSLTKEEARAYTGFECARCERWMADALNERDIPDWWEELKVTSLEGVRPRREEDREEDAEEGGVVARMSDAWKGVGGREEVAEAEREGESEREGETGDSF